MSLIAWYPLNGDTQNYGLDKITIATANLTFANAGKTSNQALDLSSTVNMASVPSLVGARVFSIIFWVYCQSDDTLTSNWQQCCKLTDQLSDGTAGNWLRFEGCWGTSLRACSIHNNSTNAIIASSPVFEYDKDVWCHVAITADGTNVRAYANGQLKATMTQQSGSLGGRVVLGGTKYKGYMNDFRLYDNCLSDKEVEEISKGLMLHFPMNRIDGSKNGANLFNNGNFERVQTMTGDTSKHHNLYPWGWGGYNRGISNPTEAFHAHVDNDTFGYNVIEYNESDGTRNWKGINQGLTADKIFDNCNYQLSVDCYCSDIGTKLFGGFYYRKIGTETNAFHNGMFYIYPKRVNEWQRLSVSVPYPKDIDTSAVIGFYLYGYSFTTNSILYIKNASLNVANRLCEYTQTPDELSIFAIDDIVEDVSGYLNNAVIDTTVKPVWSSQAILNDGSYAFNGSSSLLIDKPFSTTSDFTIATWLQLHDSTSTHTIFQSRNEVGKGLSLFAIGRNFRFDTGETADQWYTGRSVVLNEWHHVVVTKDKENKKIYIDGILQNTTASITEITNLSNYMTIGASSVNKAGYGNFLNGKLSDFRVYTRRLDADEVKDLYEGRFSIDNQYNLQCGEVLEVLPNLLKEANDSAYDNLYSGQTKALRVFTQANCQASMANGKLRIYRPPNLNQTDNGNTMWGGLKLVPSEVMDLQKEHTYLIMVHAEGKSSQAGSKLTWTNYLGWSGGGLEPKPSDVISNAIPANFDGEMELFYKFTINDEVYKICTKSYSTFIEGETYLSYNHFGIHWVYGETGEMGTDVLFSDFRMYDITEYDIEELGMMSNGQFAALAIQSAEGQANVSLGLAAQFNSIQEI